MQPARFAIRHRLPDTITDHIADQARRIVHDVDVIRIGETKDESDTEREPTASCGDS